MDTIKYIVISVVTCLGLWACYEDKGNYDYHNLDAIVIDTTGGKIRAAYSIASQDSLKIAPRVYCNGKLVNGSESQFPQLEFRWTVQQHAGENPIVAGDTLSDRIELEIKITQPQILWDLIFTVYNKQTGVREFMKFALKVNAALSEGWMVLYEKEGGTEIGLIANHLIAPEVVEEKTWLDIYSAFNREPLEGKPVRIIYSMAAKPEAVYAVSGRDIACLNPVAFTRMYSFEDLFWSSPEGRAITCFNVASNPRIEFVVNNGKAHGVSYMTSGSTRANQHFGVPCPAADSELASWCANKCTAYAGVVYDRKKQRFLCLKNNATTLVELPAQNAGVAFDCNNVGLQLVDSDFGRNNYEYMVMKSEDGHHYLLMADFCGFMTQNSIGVGKYDMAACEGLSEGITSVAAGYKGEIFYYAAGHQVYLCDYKAAIPTGEPVWEDPNGNRVTCIRLQKFYYGAGVNTPVNDCEVLYIATCDEQTGKGTVYQLRVNPSNGVPDLASQRPFYGFGRVKDMGWKRQ